MYQDSGELPLWNDLTFSGTPFIGHPMASTYYYPLNILFLKVNPDTVFKIYLFLHMLLAGISMFYLAKYLGFNRLVSLYASFVFMYGGAFIAKINYFVPRVKHIIVNQIQN